MRSLICLWTVVALVGCANTDPPPPFFDMDYQVRCRDECNNSFDDTPRTISHLDDEDGYRVECLVEGSGSDRTLFASFSCPGDDAECGGDYAFELAAVRLGGSDPGMGCKVFVTEGANTYEGDCTATEPTAEDPCQVDIDESGGEIEGTVKCINIPNAANPGEKRGVFLPGLEEPAELRILNCTGL